jgi:hypothetical protein
VGLGSFWDESWNGGWLRIEEMEGRYLGVVIYYFATMEFEESENVLRLRDIGGTKN